MCYYNKSWMYVASRVKSNTTHARRSGKCAILRKCAIWRTLSQVGPHEGITMQQESSLNIKINSIYVFLWRSFVFIVWQRKILNQCECIKWAHQTKYQRTIHVQAHRRITPSVPATLAKANYCYCKPILPKSITGKEDNISGTRQKCHMR